MSSFSPFTTFSQDSVEIESEKWVNLLSNPKSDYLIYRVNPLGGANHSICIYILCGLLVVGQAEEINLSLGRFIVEPEKKKVTFISETSKRIPLSFSDQNLCFFNVMSMNLRRYDLPIPAQFQSITWEMIINR